MAKWQYTLTESYEIDVPTNPVSEDAFLVWLADHLTEATAARVVVDSFVSEAHEIKKA